MQSPPAKAEATSVISLSPVLARPGSVAQVEVAVNQFAQPQVAGKGGGQQQPGVGYQTVIVEGNLDAIRGAQVVTSKRCSFSGFGFVNRNHYPRYPGAPFHAFRTPLLPTPSVDSGLVTGLSSTFSRQTAEAARSPLQQHKAAPSGTPTLRHRSAHGQGHSHPEDQPGPEEAHTLFTSAPRRRRSARAGLNWPQSIPHSVHTCFTALPHGYTKGDMTAVTIGTQPMVWDTLGNS